MTTWGVTAGLVLLVAGVTACGSDPSDAPTTTRAERTTTSTTVPDRPASTTTTTYAPDSVEGQVEAAYLRSWDVYADAVYHLRLDEQALAEVFTGEHLETKRTEITRRIEEKRAALVRIEHDYTVRMVDEQTALVIDTYINHQVLIDPTSKTPIEADPNETVSDAVTIRLAAGAWKVSRIEGLS